MTIWNAIFWGAFASASLFIGQAVAGKMATRERLTGQVMGFGAGAMLSAIAYQLIPDTVLDSGWKLAAAFLLGALVYYAADRYVANRGGANRTAIGPDEHGGSGASMFLGALLDGVPESFVLGTTLALGGSINIAFLAAIFVGNIPQGIAGTLSLEAAGTTRRQVFLMWTALTVASAAAAAGGYALSHRIPDQGLLAEAFAAGAVLTMLANSMMPEGFEHGGKTVGLLTVLGFLVAAILTVLQ